MASPSRFDLSHSHSHPHSPGHSSDHNIPSSPSTTVTTPDQSPGADHDIWDTSSDHGRQYLVINNNDADLDPSLDSDSRPRRDPILSDLPTLRRQHMTSGYREGLAIGKAQVMQRGFDEGYPFGVELGMRVGAILGILEGVLASLRKANGSGGSSTGRRRGGNMSPSGSSSATATIDIAIPSSSTAGVPPHITPASNPQDGASEAQSQLIFLTTLYARAKTELKVSELMKTMDDEKIARLEPGNPLPPEIESMVRRWEEVVLAAGFGGIATKEDQSEGKVGETMKEGKSVLATGEIN